MAYRAQLSFSFGSQGVQDEVSQDSVLVIFFFAMIKHPAKTTEARKGLFLAYEGTLHHSWEGMVVGVRHLVKLYS